MFYRTGSLRTVPTSLILFMKMIKQLVFCVAAFGLVASNLTPVPNQCPQPTKSRPVPYSWFYGHLDDCTKYFTCAHGQPYEQKCGPGTRWRQWLRQCVANSTTYGTCTKNSAERECSHGSTDLIPHPEVCQRYYNCSDTAQRDLRGFFRPYEDECSYPQLFDVVEKRCKPFKEANCGPHRVAAKDGCEYLKNICPGTHCRGCRSIYPKCIGRQDGVQDHPDRPWTGYFVVCDTERVVNVSYCGFHQPTDTRAIFSPVKKRCVSIWEVPRWENGLAPSCNDKTPGKYRTDERPDVYYTCPGAEVSYCPPETILNEDNGLCESFKD